jgi:hypothetical protein
MGPVTGESILDPSLSWGKVSSTCGHSQPRTQASQGLQQGREDLAQSHAWEPQHTEATSGQSTAQTQGEARD